MRTTPLLILAYNRPDKVQRLIERLRSQAPQHLMIAVDGPKPGNDDAARVAAVQKAIGAIDWTDDVETRFRPSNLGLRRAVVDAVSWAVDKHGQAIVIEEDVLPGRHFEGYANHMLECFRDDDRIAHISGYNIVPPDALTVDGRHSRLTIYPESVAWATWARSWDTFDDSMEWAMNATIADFAKITGSRVSALRWKQHFSDANSDRISTWAYRWIASMWSKGALTLSPNRNLVTYAGFDEGTNSRMKAPWTELSLYSGPDNAILNTDVERDLKADAWLSVNVFGGSATGLAKGAAISAVLELRKVQRRLTAS